jgi:rhodanese-related sulfurtransferase
METESITPKALADILRENKAITLIDVRSPAEFESAHISGAKNLPLGSSQLAQFINAQKEKQDIVYVTCQKGGRAKTACGELAKESIPFKNLEGGMSGWIEAKLPVIEGKSVISIERQVRIGAGAFVLLGVILHYIGFSDAILLSAFVGAGLMFAGITDTCGMALVLARMPWNQSTSGSGKSCCMK